MVDGIDESAIVPAGEFEGEGAVNTVVVLKVVGEPFEYGCSKNGLLVLSHPDEAFKRQRRNLTVKKHGGFTGFVSRLQFCL